MQTILKYLGLMLIFFACVMTGILKAAKLTNKTKLLEFMLHDIRCLWMRIEYTALPLFRIADSLIQAKLKDFWKSLAEKLERGDSFDSAWRASIDNSSKNNRLFAALSPKDIKLLKSFGTLIGTSDMQSQAKGIRLIESQLLNEIQLSKEISTRKERMYRSMGVLLGLGLIILFL